MKKFLAILAITIISATAAFAQVDSLPAAAAPQPVSSEPEALWAAANAAYNAGEWDKALTNYGCSLFSYPYITAKVPPYLDFPNR